MSGKDSESAIDIMEAAVRHGFSHLPDAWADAAQAAHSEPYDFKALYVRVMESRCG